MSTIRRLEFSCLVGMLIRGVGRSNNLRGRGRVNGMNLGKCLVWVTHGLMKSRYFVMESNKQKEIDQECAKNSFLYFSYSSFSQQSPKEVSE